MLRFVQPHPPDGWRVDVQRHSPLRRRAVLGAPHRVQPEAIVDVADAATADAGRGDVAQGGAGGGGADDPGEGRGVGGGSGAGGVGGLVLVLDLVGVCEYMGVGSGGVGWEGKEWGTRVLFKTAKLCAHARRNES